MSFLNLLWIYIINEKWKQYKLSKTNKEQRREVMYKKLMTCLESVQKKIDFKPEVALILGSGLGDFADGIKIEQTIDYTDIEGFPVSTVKGHKGRFVFGYVEETPVVIMQGRVHYYEGYDMTDVVLPTRLMGMMEQRKSFLQMQQVVVIQIINQEIL